MLVCKKPYEWGHYKALHLAIKHENERDYFMWKYEDLYDIYITLEGKLAYELNTNKDCDEQARSNRSYKNHNGKHLVD